MLGCVAQGLDRRTWTFSHYKPYYAPAILQPYPTEDVMALTLPAVVEPYSIPETMRAAVLFGPQDMRVIDRPALVFEVYALGLSTLHR